MNNEQILKNLSAILLNKKADPNIRNTVHFTLIRLASLGDPGAEEVLKQFEQSGNDLEVHARTLPQERMAR